MRSTGEMAIESSVLSGPEPAAFWQRFEELTTIARPRRREEPVIAHVESWADSRGIERRSDAARNMVMDLSARRRSRPA
jgi:di/tripeptidase